MVDGREGPSSTAAPAAAGPASPATADAAAAGPAGAGPAGAVVPAPPSWLTTWFGVAPPAPPAPPPPKPPRRQIRSPTIEEMQQEELMNNCGVKMALSGFFGGLMGAVFGIAMGGYDGAMGPMNPDGSYVKQTIKEAVVSGAKNAAKSSWSWFKTFGGLGATFAVSECVIEKARAKHDLWNSAYAGCASGGIMAVRGGPTAMAGGCASFAVFSVLIEKFMQPPH